MTQRRIDEYLRIDEDELAEFDADSVDGDDDKE